MARSGLVPEIFTVTYGHYKSPVMAYLIGQVASRMPIPLHPMHRHPATPHHHARRTSHITFTTTFNTTLTIACQSVSLPQGLGLMLSILGFYYPVIGLNLYNICILSAFLAYISQLAGYIVFKRKFPTQEGWFKSPFGSYGAMYAIVIFAIGAVSVIALQPDNQVAFVTVVILFCLYTSAYHFYAKGRQYFSVDEKFIFQGAVSNRFRSPGRRSMCSSPLASFLLARVLMMMAVQCT